MRTIKYIVVHATGGSQRTTIKELMLEFARLGWKAPGYHYVVHVDGKMLYYIVSLHQTTTL